MIATLRGLNVSVHSGLTKKKQISYLSSISFFEQKGESECKLFLLNLQVQKDFCILFSYV